ncbi:MAG: dienelactone hydrolase family protein [Solirubrobacterales bacterium]|jgi:carboxymethylenebutenolidase|nr:dienelactone hydrolase family protein [Solirubrobacterales bacterium]
MCFDHDALPPDLPAWLGLPPIEGAAGAELLELESADGTRFSAALAEAAEPSGAAVVVLPDVRGLYPFYSVLAERLAHAGHHAIAIDYFGRTAGLGPRDEDFEWLDHVQATMPAQIQADASAAIAALRERTGHDGPVVTVGFCFGGSQSFLAAANHELDLAGVIGFYGGLNGERFGFPSPPDLADEMRGPILGLFGGEDPSIPVEAIENFDTVLDEAGVEHEIVVYPGAPHSFFDRKFEEFAAEADDAWTRMLGFLGGAVASPAG